MGSNKIWGEGQLNYSNFINGLTHLVTLLWQLNAKWPPARLLDSFFKFGCCSFLQRCTTIFLKNYPNKWIGNKHCVHRHMGKFYRKEEYGCSDYEVGGWISKLNGFF